MRRRGEREREGKGWGERVCTTPSVVQGCESRRKAEEAGETQVAQEEERCAQSNTAPEEARATTSTEVEALSEKGRRPETPP